MGQALTPTSIPQCYRYPFHILGFYLRFYLGKKKKRILMLNKRLKTIDLIQLLCFTKGKLRHRNLTKVT